MACDQCGVYRAEIVSLQTALTLVDGSTEKAKRERDEARAEVERLKAERRQVARMIMGDSARDEACDAGSIVDLVRTGVVEVDRLCKNLDRLKAGNTELREALYHCRPYLTLAPPAFAEHCAALDTRDGRTAPPILVDVRCVSCAEPVSCPRGHQDGLMDAGTEDGDVV